MPAVLKPNPQPAPLVLGRALLYLKRALLFLRCYNYVKHPTLNILRWKSHVLKRETHV